VASFHNNTQFHFDAFVGGNDMFKGMARVQVTFPKNVYITDEYKKDMVRRLNLVIRDVSPDPPRLRSSSKSTLDTIHTAWVPSLGKAGCSIKSPFTDAQVDWDLYQ
jgi:hypothetical protein